MAKKEITVEGVTYPTIKSACKAYGFNDSTYYARKKIGLIGDDIFTTPLQKGFRLKKTVFVKGVGYRSLFHAAEAFGINYGTLTTRIQRGATLEEALTKPITPLEDATGTRLPVGTKRKNSQGYICVKITPQESARYPNLKGHTSQDRGKWWVLEHRLHMCRHLGRDLFSNEIVHHKNGDRADNRIENLELCCNKQPPGQRRKDKKNFYISWLKKHAPEVLLI